MPSCLTRLFRFARRRVFANSTTGCIATLLPWFETGPAVNEKTRPQQRNCRDGCRPQGSRSWAAAKTTCEQRTTSQVPSKAATFSAVPTLEALSLRGVTACVVTGSGGEATRLVRWWKCDVRGSGGDAGGQRANYGVRTAELKARRECVNERWRFRGIVQGACGQRAGVEDGWTGGEAKTRSEDCDGGVCALQMGRAARSGRELSRWGGRGGGRERRGGEGEEG
ncbi:hypothetical protein K505DRAFT_6622 [Melanomma pulvis-pyrius CBS 109.77]|uniref:Uncharacterized protein n=1 Tax=Melanomma pulvis-pyrius CBS 109.77 TaxID=1314802 RepID=A0A6A6XI72_9PLEO|nr:hypothetical protein K505DRAFT_6622 [Melanomma pulvis-pyrius CBS 109.77]